VSASCKALKWETVPPQRLSRRLHRASFVLDEVKPVYSRRLSGILEVTSYGIANYGPHASRRTVHKVLSESQKSANRCEGFGFVKPQTLSYTVRMAVTLPIKRMSREDKLRAMEALWEDLSREESQFESPVWHANTLRETEQLVRAGKAKFSDWAVAKERIRRKAAKLV
jgi:hypothetical protein